MITFLAAFFLLVAAAQSVAREASASPAQVFFSAAETKKPFVDLHYAKYKGKFNKTTGISSFLGIRYADAPTGEYRWRRPRPPPTYIKVQDASKYAPSCPQYHTSGEAVSEDCLFLDVYVPGFLDSKAVANLPVVVYFYGGAYSIGASYLYDGINLIQQSNYEAVVVIMQYRINVFGFLSGEAVKRDGVLNVGLLDQQFALEWVQKHIKAFGGDASKVTVWGGSAGAAAILQHMISSSKTRLFSKVITNSVYVPSQYSYNDTRHESVYAGLVNQTGCTDPEDTLECLRGLDLDKFDSWINPPNALLFSPVIDGEYITARPYEALDRGEFKGDMLLATINTHEGRLFTDNNCNDMTDIKQYVQAELPLLSDEQLQYVLFLYREFGPGCPKAAQILTDFFFVCPTYKMLRTFSGAPHKKAWKGELSILPAKHGDDIPYLFPDSDLNVPWYRNQAFDDAFVQPLTSFSVNDDPNVNFIPPNVLPQWHHWTPEDKAEIRFNKTGGDAEEKGIPLITQVQSDPSTLARCDFWYSIAATNLQ